MKLLFKQRLFSWLDSYDIYDEVGNTVYTVKGQLSWGHCLKIFDARNREVGTVKEKIFTWRPQFEMYLGDRYVGCIRKEFTLFRPQFTVDCSGWQVQGEIFEWDYTVLDAALRQVAAGVPWREAYHDVRDHLERLETEDADSAVLAKRHLGATNGLDWRMYAQRVSALKRDVAKRRRAFDAKISALLG